MAKSSIAGFSDADQTTLIAKAKEVMFKNPQTEYQKAAQVYIDALKSQPAITPDLDLSPVMQFLSANAAKSYKAPTSGKESLDRGQSLQDAASKLLAGGHIAEGESNDKIRQTIFGQLIKPPEQSGGYGANQILKAHKDIRGTALKLTNELAEANSGFELLDNAFKQGTITNVNGTMAQAARLVSGEKGVLTDNDIGRLNIPTWGKTLASFNTYFNAPENLGRKLPQPEINALRSLVDLGNDRLLTKYGDVIPSAIDTYKLDPAMLMSGADPTQYFKPAIDILGKAKKRGDAFKAGMAAPTPGTYEDISKKFTDSASSLAETLKNLPRKAK